eukprot:CCRYP_010659-RB/>CCRYP_010659-RB protein AED:0.34 eAED:0.34 QI:1188/1/1/1/1/1/7/50/687
MTRIMDKIRSRRKEHVKLRASQSVNGPDGDGGAPATPPSFYYSLEFFPPKTEPGLENLLTRIDRMCRRLDPLFVSITWGANGSTLSRTLAIASHAQRFACVDVLLHLSCTGLSREKLAQVLSMAKSAGVQNILALRGDPPRGKRSWAEGDVSGGECDRAIDLVKLVRTLHGNYFSVGVAGHPEGHPSSRKGEEGRAAEMRHLKEKMDAGADFIITQFFYDVHVFLDYVKRCRRAGIDAPIIPGIMPIQSFSSLMKMTQFCGISVPNYVSERLYPIQHDDEAVKEIGCDICSIMCRTILKANNDDPNIDTLVDGFHFYTLNLERGTTRILIDLDATDFITSRSASPSVLLEHADSESKQQSDESSHNNVNGNRKERAGSISELARSNRRLLPWKPSTMENRSKEAVRPINWSNRPHSYVVRTDDWDEFPNGRWGDATSPAFGDLSEISHFYSFTLGSDDDRRAMLGHCPLHESDVFEVFARYVEGTVPHIPWCETPLQPESFLIQPQLAKLNRFGLLTVNSQPPVDGASSSHPAFGWGGKGGKVYQKAYFECFVSPDKTNRLSQMVTKHPSINMYAINNAGQDLRVGVEEGGVTALTWGVFPNREILQPTIFDPDIFLIWAEEAFSLWSTMWLNLYDYGSESYELIERIRDTYYLVALIDNDFSSGGEDGSEFVLLDLLLEVGKGAIS